MALWKSLGSFFVFVNWYTIKYLLTGTEGKSNMFGRPKSANVSRGEAERNIGDRVVLII